MSSQFEFLDLSDLEEDEYHSLLNIIVTTKNNIYEPSQESSETQQDTDEFDTETEDPQNCCEDDFLSSSRNETSVAGISFFVDGGTAEDIDPEEIPPMLQAGKASPEVSVVEQEEMLCINEQLNLYSSNSPTPQPTYVNQPPPPPNMQHNFTGSGTHVYNMAHPSYPPHSVAGMPPVANTMYSHLPPGHPPHMGPPTVYVENCHVNFSPYGTHQQPPGALYATPPPPYLQGPHQHVYNNPYIVSDQCTVPMQVKVPHEKGEFDRNKRHDQHNRGAFRGRVRGRGRRRGRDEQERSNSVSSDHSSYSDSGVRSYKENCPAPPAPANPYNPNMYPYTYPMQYAINSMPRHGATFPILHPQFLHDPYANHQALMAYPPLQSMSVGPPVPHDHSGHATHTVECDQYTLQQCHLPDPHPAVQHQQQQIAVTSQPAYIVTSNHGNQQSECLYSDSSLEQGSANYNYSSVGSNFSHEQEVHDIEEREELKPVAGVYRSEEIDNDKVAYQSYSKEPFVSKQSDLKKEECHSDCISNMEMEGPLSNRDDTIYNVITSSEGEQMEISVEDGRHQGNVQQLREKHIILDQYSDNHTDVISQVDHSEGSKCFTDDSLTINKPDESPSKLVVVNTGGDANHSKSNNCYSPTISFLGPTISNGTKECLEKSSAVNSASNYSRKESDPIANEDSLTSLLESVSLKEKTVSVSSSSKNSQRSSPHEIELDASCTFADIEESNNIIKSPSGSLTVYKSSSKVKHVDSQPVLKAKGKCDIINNTSNSSRSSSKESLKDLPIKFHDSNLSTAPESAATLDFSLNNESTVQMPSQEAAWGQKKSWSQLFKPNEDVGLPCKPIGYVSPFNAQENGKDCTESQENSKKDQNINSDLEAEKSKVGALLKNFSPDYRPVQLVPRGLINKNYWCYVNAPLQALYACPSFYQLMMSVSKEAGISSGNTSTPFINSIVDIATEFTVMPTISKASRKEKGSTIKKDPDVVSGNPFEPTCVYKMLINCKENQFTEGRQQDAEEMLSCVLNGLHDEMVESLKLSGGSDEPSVNGAVNGDKNNCDYDISEDEHEWKVQGPKKKSCITRTAHFTPSPISQIFWGRLRSVLQQAGGSTTANLQPFNSLPLDIQSPKVDSLKDALNQLVTREEISGFTCPKTNQEVNASNQVMLEDLPRVLILQLKRFIYDKDGGLQKVTKRLQFTVDLEITKDLISLNSRGKFTSSQRKYKLFAIVNHEGKEATKGHYVADVFHTGYNCWLRYDDSSVKPIQEAIVLRHEPPRVPYLLFYRRNDTFANPNSNINNSNNNIISNSSSNNSKPK